MNEPLFSLGSIVSTPGALDAIPADVMVQNLRRHLQLDDDNQYEEDRQANVDALKYGHRIFSVYDQPEKHYIITEWDRSIPTVLLPEEY